MENLELCGLASACGAQPVGGGKRKSIEGHLCVECGNIHGCVRLHIRLQMHSWVGCGICCDLCYVSSGRVEKSVNNVLETRNAAGISRLRGFSKHAGTICADRQLVKTFS